MLRSIESEIERIITQSEVPEDPQHSRNTRAWVLRLKPGADAALQIAALGHDIERSMKELKVRREDYTDYNEFKMAHAENSARVLDDLLSGFDLDETVRQRVTDLVSHHEFGGNPEADILKDADSISYFDVNVPFYSRRHSRRETAFRMMWGYQRLSREARSIVRNFSYDDVGIEELLRDAVSECRE